MDQLKAFGASPVTLLAWECAFKAGFRDSISLASKSWRSMELIARLILQTNTSTQQNVPVVSAPTEGNQGQATPQPPTEVPMS